MAAPMVEPVPEPEPERTPEPPADELPGIELALDLDPADAGHLHAVRGLARRRGGRARESAVAVVWHDTPDGLLARRGIAIEERRGADAAGWQVVRLWVPADTPVLPGTPLEVLAEGLRPDVAAPALAAAGLSMDMLIPVVAFDGRRSTRRLAADEGAVTMVVEKGVLRAVVAEAAVCRLVLSGPAEPVLAAALAAAEAARASIPALGLAAAASRLARPPKPPPRRPEPPLLQPGMSVDAAFAHVIGHLTTTLLLLAPAAAERAGIEPVHQMRVALRRMRSAFALFARASACPELAEARQGLRELGAALGPARDWDVFTEETTAGLGDLHEGASMRQLLAAAERRRKASYAGVAAYLDSAAFRVLGVRLVSLAAVRPWTRDAGAEEADLDAFAGRSLWRLQRKLLDTGEDVTDLPTEELHALRLRAKRLRYATEFFAPLFPGRATHRFIRRVAALQEALGQLNDGAVTARLTGELSRAPGYAAGVVAGHVAARAGDVRGRIGRAWRKLRRARVEWA